MKWTTKLTWLSAAVSEGKLEGQLQDARFSICTRQLTEIHVGYAGVGVGEIGPVEKVKSLEPELTQAGFTEKRKAETFQ